MIKLARHLSKKPGAVQKVLSRLELWSEVELWVSQYLANLWHGRTARE
jgi:hypothetical protein